MEQTRILKAGHLAPTVSLYSKSERVGPCTRPCNAAGVSDPGYSYSLTVNRDILTAAVLGEGAGSDGVLAWL